MPNFQRLVRDYSLSLALLALFLVSWVAQFWFGWVDYSARELAHGATPGIGGYLPDFWTKTFENWQSEFLQLLSFTVLTTYLIHRHSPQSRDGDDEVKAMLTEVRDTVRKRRK